MVKRSAGASAMYLKTTYKDMDLLTAYNNSKLVYEYLLNIYELHNKMDN